MGTGQRVKQARLDRGLTQDELAESSGVSQAAISHLERSNGDPKIGTMRALADALGVTLDELVPSPTPTPGEDAA